MNIGKYKLPPHVATALLTDRPEILMMEASPPTPEQAREMIRLIGDMIADRAVVTLRLARIQNQINEYRKVMQGLADGMERLQRACAKDAPPLGED